MPYALIAFVTFIGSALLAWAVRLFAIRFNVVDDPSVAPERKRHAKPIALLGGVAIYAAFALVVLYLFPTLTQGYLLPKYAVGMLLAGGALIIGGALDDIYALPPYVQIIFPFTAVVITIASGIGISYISNPFGGTLMLDQWQWVVFTRDNLPYTLVLLADAFTFIWLMGTMYTTKLSDGIDGLVPGITVIGGIVIGAVSLSREVQQPETAALAFIVAAAAAGFLLWNFAPAKMYLGESGALWCGYMLGVLAIISGGKIATALLILILPIIDVLWVIIQRAIIERRSIFSGDTLHLHYQLQDLGLSTRMIVVSYYCITLAFGLTTLLASGKLKASLLFVYAFVIAMALIAISARVKRKAAK